MDRDDWLVELEMRPDDRSPLQMMAEQYRAARRPWWRCLLVQLQRRLMYAREYALDRRSALHHPRRDSKEEGSV